MCGIAGIISSGELKVDKERLQRMTFSLRHRGPNSEGYWINEKGNIGLGNRRLSVVDPSINGLQPMQFENRYTITYNGEIYNYRELREFFLKKGYRFKSHCDTEVVLVAFVHYGKDCLQYFDGMFAFAIWDQDQQTLFCARDRFGEKPFYYCFNESIKELLFASEIKAFWTAGINKQINNHLLLNYITLGWVQNPTNKQETFYEDICSLPPAHYLQLKLNGSNPPHFEIKRYWELNRKEIDSGFTSKEIASTFLQLFTNSVRNKLKSDVSLGFSCSGGLDSSAILAIANQQKESQITLRSFSALFPGFEKDESKYVEILNKSLHTEGYSVTPNEDDLYRDAEKLFYHQDEPFPSSSIYAQYKVYELAAQNNTTVLLDGQGADEILAGYTKYYPWFWQEQLAQYNLRTTLNEIDATFGTGNPIPWGIANYLAAFLPRSTARALRRRTIRQQLNHPGVTAEFLNQYQDTTTLYKPPVKSLNDLLHFNTIEFGLEELLRYADRNSMAHSREVRLPFLDHKLVEFVFSLPSTYKIKNGFTKHLLRTCMDSYLPKEIVWRRDKVGFEPPQRLWMSTPLIQEKIHFSRERLVEEGILKKEVLRNPIRPKGAHDQDNFDWRYLCAAHYI